MKKYRSIALAAVLAAWGFSGTLHADDDDHFRLPWAMKAKPGVGPVTNRVYKEECGSCHMAYPPGLLPPVSWERIMFNLEDHFGENAETDAKTQEAILNYLLNNAAGRVDYRLSNRMVRNLNSVPLRITELPYFRHEHREIPARLITGNPKVRSLSNCDACHQDAGRGFFDEHRVDIPGYGHYEDD